MKPLLRNPVIRFLGIALLLYVSWYLLYDLVIKPYTSFDRVMSLHLRDISAGFLELLGYEIFLEDTTDMVILYIDGSHGVWIGNPCNGINLFGLFTIFVLAFPGKWKRKLWFIPLGILIIHLANIIRIAILTIIAKNSPELLDFNHNYTFTITVYSIVFVLWYIWATKLSSIIPAPKNE